MGEESTICDGDVDRDNIMEDSALDADIGELYGSFIQIPGSKNRIMKGYLKLKGKDIVDKNFIHFHNLAYKISKIRRMNYRLPYLDEILTTYYKSENSDFIKSLSEKKEWLDEIVSTDKQWIIRNPVNPRFVGSEFNYDGIKQKMKIANKDGFSKKQNKFGYPESVTDKKSKDKTVYLRHNPDKSNNPIYRGWFGADVNCPVINNLVASCNVNNLSARLVEVNEY
ncbi:MAG: hypothetical protein PHU12_02700 [Candidatus Aenigmarchaeota archaeon]|nr:hypothetical protein [Candidatus Aenigmarchaeota archaeon]